MGLNKMCLYGDERKEKSGGSSHKNKKLNQWPAGIQFLQILILYIIAVEIDAKDLIILCILTVISNCLFSQSKQVNSVHAGPTHLHNEFLLLSAS